MRFGNLADRAVVIEGDRAFDVAELTGGAFGPDPQGVLADWEAFRRHPLSPERAAGRAFEQAELGPPAPRPPQVFGIGVNYMSHILETKQEAPESPMVFTKFPSAVTGPFASIELSGPRVDWEVELVVVIGKTAHRADAATAWEHVAWLTVGQDVSDRDVQFEGARPQFSVGKSLPGFAPIGPWMVTPDEVADRDDLALRCSLNGMVVQDGRTSELIFSVAESIARISARVMLQPGDLIFTGTPSGIGATRKPPVFLQPGDVLESHIEDIGDMRNTFQAPSA
jgi:2-keto-4-pentenoate hydratase/2-oxohepta-3-ene-1,7-dioic acid hydratase in catechol pathway